MRTARWFGDESFDLFWPDAWDVAVRWPTTPPPLSGEAIRWAIRHPVGLPSIVDTARGKRKPLIVIDDLTRPTPVADMIEPLLDEFLVAGIAAQDVTIVVATGTHARPSDDGVRAKIGPRASEQCRLIVHDDLGECVKVGTTRFRTPIFVNREVADADLVIGIGGIYPNNTAGFGGGSKLALGVLSRVSITHLHEKYRSEGWGSHNPSARMRRDLDEIADAIRLTALVTVHVDENSQAIRVTFGDHRRYYADEVAWAMATHRVEGPGNADIVVSNAYPMDLTLVGARMKAVAPFRHARRDASRILLASCPLGAGGHGLFPLVDRRSPLQRLRRKASVMSPRQLVGAVMLSLRRRFSATAPLPAWPLLLFRPGTGPKPDLPFVSGIDVAASWDSAIETLLARHGESARLQIVVYPCSPLQTINDPSPRRGDERVRL